MRHVRRWVEHEPTLDEMLADTIVQDLMEADGVDALELAAMLREVGRDLDRRVRCRPFQQAALAL